MTLLVAGVFLLLGWLQKSPCLRTSYDAAGAPFVDWSGRPQYTTACYSDVLVLYRDRGLDELIFPYLQPAVVDGQVRWMEYPVLTGLFQYLAAALSRPVHAGVNGVRGWFGFAPLAEEVTFFAVVALGLAACWLIGVVLLLRMVPGARVPGARVPQVAGQQAVGVGATGHAAPGRAAAVAVPPALLMAASPLVIVHAFTNFDALSIPFALGCLYAWSRRRPGWAGVLGGLGVAVKLWPAFLLGALLLLCLRARVQERRAGVPAASPARAQSPRAQFSRARHPLIHRPAAQLLGGAVGAWGLVNLPVMLASPRGWWEFFRLNSARGYEGSTLYAVIAHATGFEAWDGGDPSREVPGAGTLNLLSTALLLLLLAALTWFVLSLRTPPPVAHVAFLAVLIFLATNKVWSPQYSLWLVPLIALALPRWRLYYLWATTEAVYWYMRMRQFLPADQTPPEWLVDGMTVLRLGLLAIMAITIIRQMRQGAGSRPDPLAGILAGDRRDAVRLAS